MPPPLARIALEWTNRDDDEMTSIREAYDALEGVEYAEVFARVALREVEHAAENPQFVASLLRLLDTRPVSVVGMKGLLGLHHIYRTLERAGVRWAATTSEGPRPEDIGSALPIPGAFSASMLVGIAVVRGRVKRLPKGESLYSVLELYEDERLLPVPLPPLLPKLTPRKARRHSPAGELTSRSDALPVDEPVHNPQP